MSDHRPPCSAVQATTRRIVSSHLDLASAATAADPVLSSRARDLIEYIDAPWKSRRPELGECYVRPCTEAYVLDDGSVWYVTEGDLMLIQRLPATEEQAPRYFGLAYIYRGTIEFYPFAFPDTPRGRDIIRAIQCGLNRPLAYTHCPRS